MIPTKQNVSPRTESPNRTHRQRKRFNLRSMAAAVYPSIAAAFLFFVKGSRSRLGCPDCRRTYARGEVHYCPMRDFCDHCTIRQDWIVVQGERVTI